MLVKVSERVVIKLLSIIKDEDLRNSELIDDALPKKVTDIFLRDGCYWFYFYPLGEVVNSYNKELELCHCHQKGSHNVQSPLSNRPWGVHQGK